MAELKPPDENDAHKEADAVTPAIQGLEFGVCYKEVKGHEVGGGKSRLRGEGWGEERGGQERGGEEDGEASSLYPLQPGVPEAQSCSSHRSRSQHKV